MRCVNSRIPDELLEEISVNGVLFARALLHLEHQFGSGEGDADAAGNFGLGATRGVLLTHAVGLSHELDGDVVVDAQETETGDSETSNQHLRDTEAIEFPRERNQIGLGRDADYFPFRFRFAIHAVQASLLANLKTPLGWPRPRANWRRCVADERSAASGSCATSRWVLMVLCSKGPKSRKRRGG